MRTSLKCQRSFECSLDCHLGDPLVLNLPLSSSVGFIFADRFCSSLDYLVPWHGKLEWISINESKCCRPHLVWPIFSRSLVSKATCFIVCNFKMFLSLFWCEKLSFTMHTCAFALSVLLPSSKCKFQIYCHILFSVSFITVDHHSFVIGLTIPVEFSCNYKLFSFNYLVLMHSFYESSK